MARRLSVLEDSHFLVRYVCDDNLQVLSRVFFKTQSDLNIQCGNEYDVEWGRPKEVDRAVVLHAGCEQDMRAKLREMEDTECLPASPWSSTSLPPSPRSPTPPPFQEPKRRKKEKSLAKPEKPRATVLAVGQPPAVQPAVPEPEPADPPTCQTDEAPSTSADPPICEPRTPSTPVQGTTPVRFRPYHNSTAEEGTGSSFQLALMREMVEMRQAIDTLTKKLDAANRRIASYEATQKTVLLNTNVLIDFARNIRSKRQDPIAPVAVSTTFSLDDIPEEYAIGDEELRQIVRDSRYIKT
nr:uncharacterized protein LOC105345930 [Crassostrea gigas]